MLKKYCFIFLLITTPIIGQNQTPIVVDFSTNPIQSLTSYLTANKNMLAFYPSLFPFDSAFTISSDFGLRTHPISGKSQFHNGIDFSCPNGTVVFSVAHGRVLSVVYNDPVIGNSITISHLNNWTTSFSHLETINVSADQIVSIYDPIGTTGDSGNVTGHHLHFTIRYNKKPIDPLPLCYLHTYINELNYNDDLNTESN